MSWKLRLFYDGQCPCCLHEIAFLRRRNIAHRLVFVDITEISFQAADYGLEISALRAKIHAETDDGKILTGMSALRATYQEIDLAWVLSFTRWPGIKAVFDWVYAVFAYNRVFLGSYVTCKCLNNANVNSPTSKILS